MIKEKIQKLDASILKLQKKKIAIQDSCPHEYLKGEYHSNTGNFCKDDDSYWWEGHCLDCGLFLTADSEEDKENYYNYPKRCKDSE